MDPMARTYGTLDASESIDLWTSGLSVMEILEIEEERARRTLPANDHGPDPSVIRDHSPECLDDWLDGVEAPVRHDGPCMPRIVKDTPGGWMPEASR